ncbi:MAG: helix-turn-helix transcriptional regulator [Tetrasphaera sp.]
MAKLDAVGGPRMLILLSLVDGPKHGYALMEDIASVAGVRLGPGTLYGALEWLEDNGQIRACAAEGRRRPYEITTAGREAVIAQERLWSALASTARLRLRAAGAS